MMKRICIDTVEITGTSLPGMAVPVIGDTEKANSGSVIPGEDVTNILLEDRGNLLWEDGGYMLLETEVVKQLKRK